MSRGMSADVGVEAIAVITGSFLSGMILRSHPMAHLTDNRLAGAMMSLFLLTIPVLLESARDSPQLLHQWHRIFRRGHVQGPAISISTGLLYSYAAWSKGSGGGAWRLFAVAAATTVGMVPYTWIVMSGTNNALSRAVEGSKNASEENWAEAAKLVRAWGQLNAVRALFPLTGAVLGLMGACKLVVW